MPVDRVQSVWGRLQLSHLALTPRHQPRRIQALPLHRRWMSAALWNSDLPLPARQLPLQAAVHSKPSWNPARGGESFEGNVTAEEDEKEAQPSQQRHNQQHQGPLPCRRHGRRQGRACTTETPG